MAETFDTVNRIYRRGFNLYVAIQHYGDLTKENMLALAIKDLPETEAKIFTRGFEVAKGNAEIARRVKF